LLDQEEDNGPYQGQIITPHEGEPLALMEKGQAGAKLSGC
jgi:hypothetical protein